MRGCGERLKLNYGVGWEGLDFSFLNIEGGLHVILMFKGYIIYSNSTSFVFQ